MSVNSLIMLKSIFQENTKLRADDYKTITPIHRNDSKMINLTGTQVNNPIFNSIITPSPIFVENNLIVKKYNFQKFPFSPAETGTTHKAVVPDNFSPKGNISNDGWEELYTARHTPKTIDNPNPNNPFQPYHYGSNVSRDNLDIRKSGKSHSVFSPSRTPLPGLLLEGIEAVVSKDNIFGETGEPYIVSRLPKSDFDLRSGRLLNMGNRSVPIVRATTDTIRISKFMMSPAGLSFIGKQNLLGLNTAVQFVTPDGKLQQSPQRFSNVYNPLSTLTAISPLSRNIGQNVPNILVKRTEPDLSSVGIDIFGDSSYDATVKSMENSFMGSEPGDTTTFGNLGKSAMDKFNSAVSSITGKPTTLKEKSQGGDFMTLMQFGVKDKEKTETKKSSVKPPTEEETSELLTEGNPVTFAARMAKEMLKKRGGDKHTLKDEKSYQKISPSDVYHDELEKAHPSDAKKIESSDNGMPFYFKDLRDNAWVFFRAYLEGLTEDIAPSWESTTYVGRSEPVYTYTNAERSISFTLKLYAHTETELSMIYQKMNRLTSMCYPEYAVDNYLGPQIMKMKPPIIKFRLGELFGKSKNELTGFLETVSYEIPAEATWETKQGARVPKYVIASITFKVMHATTPSLSTDFYGYVGG